MRIGIDFDNTLACYDPVFTKLTQEWGLIGQDEMQSKQGIRQLIRRTENGEMLWQPSGESLWAVHAASRAI